MAKNISVLDCTLRDGGYINDWDFGKITISSIINGLIKTNTDFVELGFLRDCKYDENKALFNNVAEAKRIIPTNTKNTKFTLMALHDKYTIDKLEDSDGTIFAVRVTFHNYDIDEGLAYITKLMSKGYNVFVNPINIMGYSADMLLRVLEKVNKINPYAFSIVDTFGSMRYSDFQRIYSICKHELNDTIHIGLHLHENMMMAYSIAQKFYGMADDGAIIDASLYGMGREPGNLCIELIMDYINNESRCDKYNVNALLEVIGNHIVSIKAEHPWGYMPEYFLSAKYNLHRNYSEHYINKGKVSISAMDDMLSQIAENKKSTFDAAYADELHHNYSKNTVDDSKILLELKSLINSRSVLVMAPGNSISADKDKIERFILHENPFVISANFIPLEFTPDKFFFSNERRLQVFSGNPQRDKFIITSNIKNYNFESINYNVYVNSPVKSEISVPILLNLLYSLGVKTVYFAGFDGFSTDEQSFFDKSLDFPAAHNQNYNDINNEIKRVLAEFDGKIEIEFITNSHYME